jgi:hypothetical protein
LEKKRQSIIDIANGDYITFIDDDRIANTYITDILLSLEETPDCDCVVFDCICTENHIKKTYCKYGIEFE